MPGTSKVEWMHIFADQESIELSVSQYCKLHGISDKAFYNAKSRYKWATEEPSLVAVEGNDDIGYSNTGCIRFKLNGICSRQGYTKNHKNMFVVMISFDDIPEIYIVKNVTDLRKEIDGYASIVQDALFVFCNKHRNKIKCMYWDGNGFWLLYKRLEKEHFQFPIRDDGIATITKQQLRWLLEGLRMEQKKTFENKLYKYA